MPMTTYTIGQMATALDVSVTGLRQWAVEFGEYLSTGATPAKGKARRFNTDDTAVLQTIAVMRQQAHAYTEIHMALKKGERFEFVKQEEPVPMGSDVGGEGQAITITVSRLTAELAHTTGKMAATEAERDRLAESLTEERAARLEAEKIAATASLLDGELRRAREESERLRAELERARLPFWKRWGK